MRQRPPLFGLTDLLLLVTVSIWAVNLIVIKNVIGGALQPIAFTALRFALAALILLPLLRSLTPAERAVSRGDLWKIIGLGLLRQLALSGLLHHRAGLYLADQRRVDSGDAADLHRADRRGVQIGETDVAGVAGYFHVLRRHRAGDSGQCAGGNAGQCGAFRSSAIS